MSLVIDEEFCMFYCFNHYMWKAICFFLGGKLLLVRIKMFRKLRTVGQLYKKMSCDVKMFKIWKMHQKMHRKFTNISHIFLFHMLLNGWHDIFDTEVLLNSRFLLLGQFCFQYHFRTTDTKTDLNRLPDCWLTENLLWKKINYTLSFLFLLDLF